MIELKGNDLAGQTGAYQNKHSFVLYSEIVFGNPKSVQCSGVGICRLFRGKLRNQEVKTVSARFVFCPKGGFKLHMRRSDLTEQLYVRQFAGNRFIVQTEVPWPRWIQKQLPLTAPSRIAPGVYTCREQGIELVIDVHV